MTETLEHTVQTYIARRAMWLRLGDQIKYLEVERETARLDMEQAHTAMEARIMEEAETVLVLEQVEEAEQAPVVPIRPSPSTPAAS